MYPRTNQEKNSTVKFCNKDGRTAIPKIRSENVRKSDKNVMTTKNLGYLHGDNKMKLDTDG